MAEQKLKSLNLILKADVQGSLEALVKELAKLENPEVPTASSSRPSAASPSDILLADASQAVVIGFRVAPEDRAIPLAEDKKIDIRRYDIIYQVTDEIKKAIEGMLVPELKEVHLGRAVVRQAFKISKVGTVAGCFVTQGTIERNAKVRIIREGREVDKERLECFSTLQGRRHAKCSRTSSAASRSPISTTSKLTTLSKRIESKSSSERSNDGPSSRR